MNPKARAILTEGDGLTLNQERLSTATGVFPMDGVATVARPSGKEAYVVWITPLYNGSAAPSYRVVTIYQAKERRALDLALLKTTFKFTRAELALAEQILLGRQPQEAAVALDVTIHSVRTYLKRLYNKVGVRTQAKLVRRLIEVTQTLPDAPM